MRRVLEIVAGFGLLVAAGRPLAAGAPPARWIVVVPAARETSLRAHGIPVWGRDGEFAVGQASDAALQALASDGAAPVATIRDDGQWIYFLFHREGAAPPAPPEALVRTLSPTTDLWLFPGDRRVELPRVRKPEAAFMAVARSPLPPVAPHPADLAPAASRAAASINPLVQQIVDGADQATWFQTVKDLSGENPVVIGGQTWTISTRYSDAMFPTPQDNAHATEYLLDRGAGWGYAGVRESYTSADSGCGGQTKAWQNVVFTLPGQVDFGEHQQVIFVNHYDSLSFSTSESLSYAPGADDAISGGVALLEALRLFRSYAFRNTVKVIFFTGEEEGICGSGAYVRQHPSNDMWRVVNMDQTAFDGNGDRLMDIYNWDALNSPGSVALGDAFVQANTDYGPIIDPAKIVRDPSKMCQTDHCPFWNVGVASIAVCEDLHDNDICPCFDQSQTPTCHDTVTQLWNGQLMFTQDYSWPTEKAAIATVASLADPLYACPPSAPTPAAAPGNNSIQLTWPAVAGVTSYVVERAPNCAGPFTALASVTGTSFDDTGVSNGTSYGYRIRTCPTQVGSCVDAAPQPGPSVVYEAGSATVTDDSGDHDGVPDNCELVTVRLDLVNDGNVPLTNVRLASVSSDHPAVQVVSEIPQFVGPLGVGAAAPVSFKFYLGRNGSSAACGDALPFSVVATSNESPSSLRGFDLTAERNSHTGTLTYGFETDYSGWTVTSGGFTRNPGGAPGSTTASLHSRNVADGCDAVISPLVEPTATSTMTMYVNYGIEAGSFDRAVVRAVDPATGVKTLLVPTGATYNTAGDALLLCDNVGNLSGWSGSHATWRPASFDLSPFAGIPIEIEVRYSTDDFVQGSQGFWFDAVQITNATQIDCDSQSDACAALPAEVSPIGAAVPFTIDKSGSSLILTFSESAGATQYEVYPGTIAGIHQGLYDHAAAAGLCGFTDSTTGDGQVTVTVAASTVPDDSYLLAVARNAAGESVYGLDSRGASIPLALASCP